MARSSHAHTLTPSAHNLIKQANRDTSVSMWSLGGKIKDLCLIYGHCDPYTYSVLVDYRRIRINEKIPSLRDHAEDVSYETSTGDL